jgi:hypothetical protein
MRIQASVDGGSKEDNEGVKLLDSLAMRRSEAAPR